MSVTIITTAFKYFEHIHTYHHGNSLCCWSFSLTINAYMHLVFTVALCSYSTHIADNNEHIVFTVALCTLVYSTVTFACREKYIPIDIVQLFP